jgi:hypothetical protein
MLNKKNSGESWRCNPNLLELQSTATCMHTYIPEQPCERLCRQHGRVSSRSKKTASRFLLPDGKDPFSNVAAISTVSSKVSSEPGMVEGAVFVVVVAITTNFLPNSGRYLVPRNLPENEGWTR